MPWLIRPVLIFFFASVIAQGALRPGRAHKARPRVKHASARLLKSAHLVKPSRRALRPARPARPVGAASLAKTPAKGVSVADNLPAIRCRNLDSDGSDEAYKNYWGFRDCFVAFNPSSRQTQVMPPGAQWPEISLAGN